MFGFVCLHVCVQLHCPAELLSNMFARLVNSLE